MLSRHPESGPRLFRRGLRLVLFVWGALLAATAAAQTQPLRPLAPAAEPGVSANVPVERAESLAGPIENGELALPPIEEMLSPSGLSATMKLLLLMTVLSLAPSILIMTTCFIRFVVVLSLLRQAIGTQNLPPNQVIVSLCLFLTLMVMAPVWRQAYEEGIAPYSRNEPLVGQLPGEDRLTRAFLNTARPLRRFMSDQIEMTGNSDAVWMFLEFHRPPAGSPGAAVWKEPETYDDLPLTVLLPSYMLSELKTAFVIGFQIYLPFVVIDLVVSAVLISMGMIMLPPVLVSLPFKLLLFVLIDGWFLTVGMLLESVRPFG